MNALGQVGARSVDVDEDASRPLADRVRDAAQGQAEIVLAAGGDGTVTAVASALIGTKKILALLPLGTANLLARDLRIPLALDQAIAALSDMEPMTIDVGELNGHVFLHKVVVGFAPAVAAGRERIRKRADLPALFGFVRYFGRQVMRPHDLRLELEADGGAAESIRVRSIAVANNAYDEGLGLLFSRSTLNGGHLTVYTARHLGMFDIVRLAARMALGSWRKDEALTERRVSSTVLRSRRKLLQVMIDGEVERMATPLRFRIRPGALRVLAPAMEPDAVRNGEIVT